jgi:hypothetical protein
MQPCSQHARDAVGIAQDQGCTTLNLIPAGQVLAAQQCSQQAQYSEDSAASTVSQPAAVRPCSWFLSGSQHLLIVQNWGCACAQHVLQSATYCAQFLLLGSLKSVPPAVCAGTLGATAAWLHVCKHTGRNL